MPTPVNPPNARAGLPLAYGSDAAGQVFVSGMVGYHPTTGELAGGGLADQADRALRNVALVLDAAGLGLADVASVRVYLADVRRDFAEFNTVYRRWFSGPAYPARTVIGAVLADPRLLVEVDAVAVR